MIKYRILRLDGQEAGGMKSWSRRGDFIPAELKAHQASFDSLDEAAAVLRELRKDDPDRADLLILDSYTCEVPGRAEALASMKPGEGVLYRYFDKLDQAREFCELVEGYMGYYYYGNAGLVFPVYKEA